MLLFFAKVSFSDYGMFCDLNHVLLGVFSFLLFKKIFDCLPLERIAKFLNISDEYSYEEYLVHQFVILGPFSLLGLFCVLGINIACAVAISNNSKNT